MCGERGIGWREVVWGEGTLLAGSAPAARQPGSPKPAADGPGARPRWAWGVPTVRQPTPLPRVIRATASADPPTPATHQDFNMKSPLPIIVGVLLGEALLLLHQLRDLGGLLLGRLGIPRGAAVHEPYHVKCDRKPDHGEQGSPQRPRLAAGVVPGVRWHGCSPVTSPDAHRHPRWALDSFYRGYVQRVNAVGRASSLSLGPDRDRLFSGCRSRNHGGGDVGRGTPPAAVSAAWPRSFTIASAPAQPQRPPAR